MSRKSRSVMIVVGVVVAILVAVPFLIPVNQFRSTIETRASAALGRKVEVGNLSLSLLSGSLSAENLSVADDPKFSNAPFLTAKSVKIGVEMMPLIFSKALNITGATIENPQVTLLRNSAGRWNYSSLGSAAAKEQGKADGASKLSVDKFTLKDGSIIVGSTNSQKRSTYDHVNVEVSNLSATSKFPITVTSELPGGGKFKLEGTAGPMNLADADLTPVDAKLNVTSLNLASTGLLDASAGLGGLLDLDATMASQDGEAETKGQAKITKAMFVAGGSPSTEPAVVDFNTKYNLRKDIGVLNPSTLKIGNAASHLRGTYDTAGEETVVHMKIDGEGMPAKDLEAFLPALGVHIPSGASIQGGTLNTNLSVDGPINRLVTNGTAGLYSARLANFDLGSKMSAISALTGLKTGKDLDIEKFVTNVRVAPNGLKVESLQALIPALGSLAGTGTIDAKNNLDFKMAATLTKGLAAAGSPAAGVTGILGQLTGSGASGCKSSAAVVPFMVRGTTSNPQFVPDVGGIAAGMLKSQLGCMASGLASGPGASTAPATAQGAAPSAGDVVNQLGGLFKKKSQ
ncbi:MAG: hypothetical protein NVS9B4_04500 [Candidatus Acidiferrum sp.]